MYKSLFLEKKPKYIKDSLTLQPLQSKIDEEKKIKNLEDQKR